MSRKGRKFLTLGLIMVAIVGCIGLGVFRTRKVATIAEVSSPQRDVPSIGGPFDLIDKAGKRWQESDFHGKPLLIYFGYTYCPDICPTALYTMSQAIEKLGGASVIQPLFITIDPQRDTPAQLENYSQNFLKDFVMLTGSKAQVELVLKAYRVHAARVEDGRGSDDYLMDHSSLIYLMDEKGKYLDHFDHKSSSAEIIDRVKKYVQTGK